MRKDTLRVIILTCSDGSLVGPDRIAWNLFEALRHRGHEAWLAVSDKTTANPHVLKTPHDQARTVWEKFWMTLHERLKPLEARTRGVWLARQILPWLAKPVPKLAQQLGLEDFHHPGSSRILHLPPRRPDLLHIQELTGLQDPAGPAFDLRALPLISRRIPTLYTPHDSWAMTGHCAHSFGCERWRSGCGRCPDLTIPPAIRRDASAYNWRRKKRIYAKSRLYVTASCQWMMDKVNASILASAVAGSRVIPCGVNQAIFHPAERPAVRAALGLPADIPVLLFTAGAARTNPFKDYPTIRQAMGYLARRFPGRRLIFLVLGDPGGTAERIGPVELAFLPIQTEADVARYYQAADIYLHAAREDTFPNAVLEALACGIPVVATAVGGIPEQVRSLQGAPRTSTGGRRYGEDEATGVLVAPGDPEALAAGTERLLGAGGLRRRLGENAARDARTRFDTEGEVDNYLQYYNDILGQQ
jgi:glycosyltransferase involved in cell wall biosynthesis